MVDRKEQFNVGMLMKARKETRQEKGKIKEELTKVMVRKKDLRQKEDS